MPNRAFISLAERLASSAPGCPKPVLVQHIRDAAIDVCERTLAWRYVQPELVLTPGVADYPYDVPSESEVHAILAASVNGTHITPITLEQAHSIFPTWPDMDVSQRANPRFILQLDVDNFAVAPVPDASQTYKIKMILALKPLRTASGMDKTAFDDLEDPIMHGALQTLLVLPNKPWSDRELAAYHAKQYLARIVERRARANLGAGRASVSVRMRPLI